MFQLYWRKVKLDAHIPQGLKGCYWQGLNVRVVEHTNKYILSPAENLPNLYIINKHSHTWSKEASFIIDNL